MSEEQNPGDRSIALALKDLQREMRRTRDMAGRATVLAGLGLIMVLLLFCVTMLGLDGLRDNLKILATADSEDFQDATEAAMEDSQLGLDEAAHMAGNLPKITIGEWPGEGKR